MMYLKKLLISIKDDPMVFAMGLSIVLLAMMGTSVRHASSAMFAILFLLSFSAIFSWPKVFSRLSRIEKFFMLAFFLYTVSGLLAYYNVDDVDKYIKLLERYFRFLIAIPIFLLMVNKNRSLISYLYMGAALSGPFVLYLAISHHLLYPGLPAKGYYHHIIFGQLAMVNVGVMIAYLITRDLKRMMQFAVLVSILCGLVAVVLSQARGVWIVFPVYLVIAFAYLIKSGRFRLKTVLALFVLTTVIVSVTPVGDLVKQRTGQAYNEISDFYGKGRYASSVGARLAMWDIALDVWKQYPILGTGPGDFDDEVLKRQAEGEYKGMELHNSTHNVFVQALVGAGLVGLLALMFVFLMPLSIIYYNKSNENTARLSGVIIVLSFAIFGLSESWVLRLSITSVFLVYLITVIAHLRIVSGEDIDVVNDANR